MNIFFLNSFFFFIFLTHVFFIIECTKISLVWKEQAILKAGSKWGNHSEREIEIEIENSCAERPKNHEGVCIIYIYIWEQTRRLNVEVMLYIHTTYMR